MVKHFIQHFEWLHSVTFHKIPLIIYTRFYSPDNELSKIYWEFCKVCCGNWNPRQLSKVYLFDLTHKNIVCCAERRLSSVSTVSVCINSWIANVYKMHRQKGVSACQWRDCLVRYDLLPYTTPTSSLRSYYLHTNICIYMYSFI